MKLRHLLLAFLSITSFLMVGCATNDDRPKPPREQLNRIPHNQPASWEGSAGYGFPTSY